MPSDLHGVDVKTVDLSSLIPSPIYDQGEQNPVCWAIAFAGATEAMVNRNRHDDKWIASPQELMDDFLTNEEKQLNQSLPTRVSGIWIHIQKCGLSQTKDYPVEPGLRPMLDRDMRLREKVPASKVPAAQVPRRDLLRIGDYEDISDQWIDENKLLKTLTTQPVVAAVRP
ncbi:unnamed protein product [Linum trigynum]|uniref:Calpain catalytic domain-containing protein n=1 Tax=Linum trigynum TaxID=586398 RepID=A0AAV2F0A4_9ROSI